MRVHRFLILIRTNHGLKIFHCKSERWTWPNYYYAYYVYGPFCIPIYWNEIYGYSDQCPMTILSALQIWNYSCCISQLKRHSPNCIAEKQRETVLHSYSISAHVALKPKYRCNLRKVNYFTPECKSSCVCVHLSSISFLLKWIWNTQI